MSYGTRRTDGAGWIDQLVQSRRRAEITPQDLERVEAKLREVINKINGGLTFGSASLGQGSSRQSVYSGNFDGEVHVIVTPPVSNTEFPVKHGIGRKPTKYLLLDQDSNGDLRSSSRDSWNADVVYFTFNQPSRNVLIWLGV